MWKEGTIETIPKHAGNNCYTHIPVSLAWVPAEETVRRLRRILCTTYAGRDDAREIDENMEVLALDGLPLPHNMMVVLGQGQNGKSAKSKLRANVFGKSHRFVSPSVFHENEEFRKQGCQFAQARCMVVQECNPGQPLLDNVLKTFISGGKIGCRPNFGIETCYLSWECAAKYLGTEPNVAINRRESCGR